MKKSKPYSQSAMIKFYECVPFTVEFESESPITIDKAVSYMEAMEKYDTEVDEMWFVSPPYTIDIDDIYVEDTKQYDE